MTRHIVSTCPTLALACLLAACGSGAQVDAPARLLASAPQANVAAAASTATMPAPDCAAEGCRGLRIIDANAEAARYAGQQRGADPHT